MSSLTTLARPYAKAAFELAQDDNDLGRWDDMLNLAGYDLDRARFALVKIGVLTGKEETSVSDTHPAGPERLASYDGLVPIVLNDQDGFPGSDEPEQDEVTVASQDSADEDKRKCRIYLPEDDICIH